MSHSPEIFNAPSNYTSIFDDPRFTGEQAVAPTPSASVTTQAMTMGDDRFSAAASDNRFTTTTAVANAADNRFSNVADNRFDASAVDDRFNMNASATVSAVADDRFSAASASDDRFAEPAQAPASDDRFAAPAAKEVAPEVTPAQKNSNEQADKVQQIVTEVLKRLAALG